MAFFMKEFEHLKIPLEAIKTATKNFDERRVIGIGGFGKVYKGKLSRSNRNKNMFAVKRLNRNNGQGDPEFYKEIRMLCCYRHENLISLLGFCNEEGEMILVYEYASRGSLDRLLSDVTLTWTQRIKICLDAAKGLSFLHDPNGTQQRVLHCDIKSANILLDKNMIAKVSDFGLSKMGPAYQQYSHLITNPVGTPGYCDPLYMNTYSLTKESDVYSFGVVLFEVLCGRLCAKYSNGQFKVYVPFWKNSCKQKKLDEIIFRDLVPQMDPNSLEIFANIAYQCLHKSRKERPAMSLVVEQLKISLEFQERHNHWSKKKTYKELVKDAVTPLTYGSLEELKVLLSKGVLLKGGKTWFSINDKGQHHESIYIEACLDPDKIADEITNGRLQNPSDDYGINPRFPGGLCYRYHYGFKALVKAQFLSPQIAYTVNLVFRYNHQWQVPRYHPLRYKLRGKETQVFMINSIDKRKDGWFMAPLYQFTSQRKTVDLEIMFEFRWDTIEVAGIEFQPLEEKVELLDHEVLEEYQEILKNASHVLVYRSLEELKMLLSKGFHLNGYRTWFSLDENGEHREMISIADCSILRDLKEEHTSKYELHYISKFPVGLYDTECKGFNIHVRTQFLSPQVTYTVNLVYYGIIDHRKQDYIGIKYKLAGETKTSTAYLGNKGDDGLYVAELYQFISDGNIVDLEILFENKYLIHVEGILFQPLEKVKHPVSEDDKVDMQTISDSHSDSGTYCEEKLRNEYEDIIKMSKDTLEWATPKELYSILCKGFLTDNGQEWFYVDKNGKKCQMLSAKATCIIRNKNLTWKLFPSLRFRIVLITPNTTNFYIVSKIRSHLVSPETTYACYLVYKLPQDQSAFEAPLEVRNRNGGGGWFIFLVSPRTRVIRQKFSENVYNSLDRARLNTVPHQRSDGWMEVKVWEFQTITTTETTSMHLKLRSASYAKLRGLSIQGIELRPI